MDPRVRFFLSLIEDKSKRILELGPLNRPIADKRIYPNTFYCDIRSTEEVQKLYSGNAYLEATGIKVEPETIIPIDYVVAENYEKTFMEVEKFDCVVASHVLEHMTDLIFALRDIGTVLKPGGIFCIIYPDKRYCFDHFRTSARFCDAYNVFHNGTVKNAPMVLDFFYSVISENNPAIFWNGDGILNYLPTIPFEKAVEKYEQALKGVKMDDVHYWPFTDMDFLKFLYDCIRARLIPFRCISFCPCAENDQQFMVALQYDESVLTRPEQALSELAMVMQNAIPDYFSSKNIRLARENENLKDVIDQQNKVLQLQQKAIDLIEKKMMFQDEKAKACKQDIDRLESQVKGYKEIIEEQEKVIEDLKEDCVKMQE